MKTVTLHGVPYQIDDKNNVYMYQPSSLNQTPIALGTWDPEKEKLTLIPDWKQKAKSFVEKYRSDLHNYTEESLEKAKALQLA
jgi:hypothetical protein